MSEKKELVNLFARDAFYVGSKRIEKHEQYWTDKQTAKELVLTGRAEVFNDEYHIGILGLNGEQAPSEKVLRDVDSAEVWDSDPLAEEPNTDDVEENDSKEVDITKEVDEEKPLTNRAVKKAPRKRATKKKVDGN